MRAVACYESLPAEDPASLVDVELPDPEPGPRDLVVAVGTVAVNPLDVKQRRRPNRRRRPRVLGWDAAGTVVAAGTDTELVRPGDEVFYAGTVGRQGTNAELHAVDERLVARKPVCLSLAEAAALPLTTIAAWEALFERLRIPRDGCEGTLLVTAGAGGVGSVALQLARAVAGLTVIATASRPQTRAWALGMGAHHVVDHHAPLADQLAELAPCGLDYVLSSVGTAELIGDYGRALKPYGAIVALDEPELPDLRVLKPKSISFHWESAFTRPLFDVEHGATHQLLSEVARLVDAGTLRTTLSEELGTIDADNLRRAHARIEAGTAIGKLVLSGF